MLKVFADKSLGYDETEQFRLPEGFDPCKDTEIVEEDEIIDEPVSGLDDLFN